MKSTKPTGRISRSDRLSYKNEVQRDAYMQLTPQERVEMALQTAINYAIQRGHFDSIENYGDEVTVQFHNNPLIVRATFTWYTVKDVIYLCDSAVVAVYMPDTGFKQLGNYAVSIPDSVKYKINQIIKGI